MRIFFLAPISLFLILAIYFAVGLKRDPAFIPSMLIDRPAPDFALPPLEGYDVGFSSTDLKGRVTLVNIFGSWCISCQVEHPVLMRIKNEGGPPIYGLDWKDKPGDGARWLQRHGNPYDLVGADRDGRVAIDFGVTGAPETFVVDAEGRIRHKHVGPITEDIWRNVLAAMIEEPEDASADPAADPERELFWGPYPGRSQPVCVNHGIGSGRYCGH